MAEACTTLLAAFAAPVRGGSAGRGLTLCSSGPPFPFPFGTKTGIVDSAGDSSRRTSTCVDGMPSSCAPGIGVKTTAAAMAKQTPFHERISASSVQTAAETPENGTPARKFLRFGFGRIPRRMKMSRMIFSFLPPLSCLSAVISAFAASSNLEVRVSR